MTPIDPQVAVGSEAYMCWLFNAAGARGGAVHTLHWTPAAGGVWIHHAMIYTTTTAASPSGPVPCDPMPPALVVLPLYAPGGETEAIADGVSIAIPDTAAAIFVQLHLVRITNGSSTASVDLLASDAPPAHLAHWIDDGLVPPSLPPHAVVTATSQCRLGGSVQVVASWPHMHRLGSQFHSTIVHADGGREPLLDLSLWDFEHQPLYAVDASVAAGDAVETACTWDNTTGAMVDAGPFSTDEMCNQGLVAWPQENAYCLP
jgi:hypothetical protein